MRGWWGRGNDLGNFLRSLGAVFPCHYAALPPSHTLQQTLCMLTIVGKVYWHHQRKAAGDLIVGCRLNYTQGEHSRRCSKAWSMLANTRCGREPCQLS